MKADAEAARERSPASNGTVRQLCRCHRNHISIEINRAALRLSSASKPGTCENVRGRFGRLRNTQMKTVGSQPCRWWT